MMDTFARIEEKQDQVSSHPIYGTLTNKEALKTFMSYHVYAVEDFMHLLKSIQNTYASSKTPWEPHRSPKIGRFITEIVLDEEFDICPEGNVMSHADMYRKAMSELDVEKAGHDEPAVKGFTKSNRAILNKGRLSNIALFYFGREKLIPEMFQNILDSIDQEESKYFTHYLKRHIECDEEDHGPRALEVLQYELERYRESHPYGGKAAVEETAMRSLSNREMYWDYIYGKILRNHN